MENGKTLERILSDLENEGYQTESFIIPACAVGAWHRRDRIWIVGRNVRYAQSEGLERRNRMESAERLNERCENVPDSTNQRQQTRGERHKPSRPEWITGGSYEGAKQWQLKPPMGGVVTGLSLELDGYWDREPEGIPRVATGVKNRVDRLKGLGNAIVPQVVFEVFKAIENVDKY